MLTTAAKIGLTPGTLIHKWELYMVGCIIGSFRKYFDDVLLAIERFEKSGHRILSPRYSSIIRDEEGFVILESDDPSFSHLDIQTLVFHRAFRSDFVYVWNPEGYIGKTTAYEIGRLTEREIPLFYKEYPKDIPLFVPNESVISIDNLITYINLHGSFPLYNAQDNQTYRLINDLKQNKFHD